VSPAPRPLSSVEKKALSKETLERAKTFENGSPKLRASWTYRWQEKEENAKLFMELGVGSRKDGRGRLMAIKTLARVQLKKIKDANDAECGARSFKTFGVYGVGRRSWFLLGQECPSAGEVRKVLGEGAKQYFRNAIDREAKPNITSQLNR
jgi:hypothetical protein